MDAGRVAPCPARGRAGSACPAVVRWRADTDRDRHISVLLTHERVSHCERLPSSGSPSSASINLSLRTERDPFPAAAPPYVSDASDPWLRFIEVGSFALPMMITSPKQRLSALFFLLAVARS